MTLPWPGKARLWMSSISRIPAKMDSCPAKSDTGPLPCLLPPHLSSHGYKADVGTPLAIKHTSKATPIVSLLAPLTQKLPCIIQSVKATMFSLLAPVIRVAVTSLPVASQQVVDLNHPYVLCAAINSCPTQNNKYHETWFCRTPTNRSLKIFQVYVLKGNLQG